MKGFLFLLLLVLSHLYANGRTLLVIDADDATPVSGATIISSGDIIIGYTDEQGKLEINDNGQYPLTIRCAGYAQAEGVGSDKESVALSHIVFELPEVTVDRSLRPVERTLCYVRQYVTMGCGRDTLISFTEILMDFFSVRGKVKGFGDECKSRVLASKSYVREVEGATSLDTVYSPDHRDVLTDWDNLLTMPRDLPPIAGPQMESVSGKYGIARIVTRTPSLITVTEDYLADYKNHKFSPFILKMLGLTMDFTVMRHKYAFAPEEGAPLSLSDLTGASFSMRLTGKGKLLRKAMGANDNVEVYMVYEIYPVSDEFLTVEESKSMLKEKDPACDIIRSPFAPPLSRTVREMISRSEKKSGGE